MELINMDTIKKYNQLKSKIEALRGDYEPKITECYELENEVRNLYKDIILELDLLSKMEWEYEHSTHGVPMLTNSSYIDDYKFPSYISDELYPHGRIFLSKDIRILGDDGQISIVIGTDSTNEEIKSFISNFKIKIKLNSIDEDITKFKEKISQLEGIKDKFIKITSEE